MTARAAALRAIPAEDWVWVLDDRLAADDEALPALTARAEDQPDLGLVAGLVVDEAGYPVPDMLPRAPQTEPEEVFTAAQEGTLPVRWTPLAHVLVRRGVVEDHGLPDESRYGAFAAVEWSARVLRSERGLFVTASRAVLEAPLPPLGPRAIGDGVRLWRSRAVTPGESLALTRAAVRRR